MVLDQATAFAGVAGGAVAMLVTACVLGTTLARLVKGDRWGWWALATFLLTLVGAGLTMVTAVCLMTGYINFGWLREHGQLGTVVVIMLGVWAVAALVGWVFTPRWKTHVSEPSAIEISAELAPPHHPEPEMVK